MGNGDGERRAGPRDTRKNAGLSKLAPALKSRYFGALKSIGVSPPEDLPVVHIDRTGYSPEVADALGSDYLSGHLVLLTEHQEHLPAVQREYSDLSDLAEVAFAKFRYLVLSVLPNEALVISTKRTLAARRGGYDLSAYLEGVGKKGGAELALRKKGICTHEVVLEAFTQTKAVDAARSVVGTLEDISEKTIDDFLLGGRREELERCAKAINSLGRRYDLDGIHRLACAVTECKRRLEEPFRYRSPEMDIDVVPAPEPFLIYSGNIPELAAADGKPFAVIEVSETDRLIEHLFGAGYLELDSKRIRRRLQEMGIEALWEADCSNETVALAENDPMMLYQELKKPEVRKHIPKEWFALRDIGSMLKGKTGSEGMMGTERGKLAELYLKLNPDSKVAVSCASEKARESGTISSFLGYWLPELEG